MMVCGVERVSVAISVGWKFCRVSRQMVCSLLLSTDSSCCSLGLCAKDIWASVFTSSSFAGFPLLAVVWSLETVSFSWREFSRCSRSFCLRIRVSSERVRLYCCWLSAKRAFSKSMRWRLYPSMMIAATIRKIMAASRMMVVLDCRRSRCCSSYCVCRSMMLAASLFSYRLL